MREGDRSNLCVLIERIACLGRLPEHLLWEAAKAMAIDRSSSPGRRFAHLVEAGAMLDAAILLVGTIEPSRSIASIAIRGKTWICTIDGGQTSGRKTTRMHRAAHADLAAAVLMALLSSRLEGQRTTYKANVSSHFRTYRVRAMHQHRQTFPRSRNRKS